MRDKWIMPAILLILALIGTLTLIAQRDTYASMLLSKSGINPEAVSLLLAFGIMLFAVICLMIVRQNEDREI